MTPSRQVPYHWGVAIDDPRLQLDLRPFPAEAKQRLTEMAHAKGFLSLTAFVRAELLEIAQRPTTNVVVLQKAPWAP